MSNLFDKLTKGFGSKQAQTNEESLAKFKEQLGGILYDEELVDEFAPIFAKLSQHEGFDKVVELLETKERQLESFSETNWNQHESGEEDTTLTQEQEEEESENNADLSAEAILREQFKEHK